MITSLELLSADARAAAQRYLDASAERLPAELRPDVVDELTAYLCERLTPEATAADVEALVAEAGPAAANESHGWFERLVSGLRLRNVDARIADTWWNPADQRILLPRAVGLGWDVNVGAIAVRLGLIEPDAETVPFSSTPRGAFVAAAALPATMAAATALHYLVRGRALPASLPTHWDVSGAPDRWTPKGRAALSDIATTVGAAAVALRAATSERPPTNRAGAIAGATLIAGIGAGNTLARLFDERPRPWLPAVMLAPGLAGVAAVLTYLARAGRAAEIKHDVENKA